MKLNLLLCGKTDFPWTATGMDIYSKRIKNYVPFDIKVLPDLKNTANLSADEIKTAEGQKILNAMTPSDFVILLDENGRSLSSVDFASDIQKLMNSGRKNIFFVIGGPYGFSKKVYERANDKISLSPMTFSHQIVRLIFLEQLYRAFTILNNEPYHHA
jgi:23S rRNA (pseudouridine1915-N3)-methyltransferase